MIAAGIDDIDRLIAEAERLPHGPSRIALVEEAVRIADSRNDLPKAFQCRLELVSAASSGGQPDVQLVAFSWCLSQFDRDKKLFGGRATEIDLLWKYKWIAGALPAFYQISRGQIAATVEDLRRRYKADGSILERGRACYTARRDGKAWKIIALSEIKPGYLGPGDIAR